MSGRVFNKVVIVTGAGSNPGLGRAAAMKLAAEGAKVVVTDVDAAGAEDCAAAIQEVGGEALALQHDVTSEQRWQEVIAQTIETYGQLDVLVNNAGIAVLKPIADLSLEDFNRQQEVNLTSVFLGCKYAMAQMCSQGNGGALINLSSVAGLVGMQRCVAYSASKGGVRAMTKSIAMDGAKDNIRCNSVHPGIILTNMQATAGGGPQLNKDTELPRSSVPLGRAGDPDDIANCILYLASDEASYVTGAEFTIDAGMTAQ
jgi:NAD(P)-dependent dehydrogenase (short-subunit alcohol dehydrogenase family)